jgi:hypothetical protein
LLFCGYFVGLYILDQHFFANTQSSNLPKNLQTAQFCNYRWNYWRNPDDVAAICDHLVQSQLHGGPDIVTVVYLLESYNSSLCPRRSGIKGIGSVIVLEEETGKKYLMNNHRPGNSVTKFIIDPVHKKLAIGE